MITCPVFLQSIDFACGSNIGGVKEIAISNWGFANYEFEYQVIDTKTQDEYTALDSTEQAKYELVDEVYVQYAKDIDGEKIISAVKTATLNSGFEKAKKYAFNDETCSFTETLQANTNGVNFWQASVNMVFSRQDSAKRLSISALMQGRCQIILTDNNNKRWLIGYERPLRMTSGDITTGTAFADDNTYTISLTASSSIMSIPVSEEAYTVLVEQ